jgi:hypothetical protein
VCTTRVPKGELDVVDYKFFKATGLTGYNGLLVCSLCTLTPYAPFDTYAGRWRTYLRHQKLQIKVVQLRLWVPRT